MPESSENGRPWNTLEICSPYIPRIFLCIQSFNDFCPICSRIIAYSRRKLFCQMKRAEMIDTIRICLCVRFETYFRKYCVDSHLIRWILLFILRADTLASNKKAKIAHLTLQREWGDPLLINNYNVVGVTDIYTLRFTFSLFSGVIFPVVDKPSEWRRRRWQKKINMATILW